MTANEARIKAAELLIKKYGFDFVAENVNKKLFSSVADLEDCYQVNFEMFKDILDLEPKEAIVNKEDFFPEILLSIKVNKLNGVASVT